MEFVAVGNQQSTNHFSAPHCASYNHCDVISQAHYPGVSDSLYWYVEGVTMPAARIGTDAVYLTLIIVPKATAAVCAYILQTAGVLRCHRQQTAADDEQALYAANPDAAYWAPHATLPPPPGVLKAQQMWAAASSSNSGRNSPDVEVIDTIQKQSPQAGRIDKLVLTGSPSKLGMFRGGRTGCLACMHSKGHDLTLECW